MSGSMGAVAPGRGRLFGVGVGPGDPELMTRRAVRVVESSPVVAHFAARNRRGNSLATVEELLRPDHVVERLEYPVTVEPVLPDEYRRLLDEFHDSCADRLAAHLDAGRDVAVISEGDPLFYGSYMHLHVRLAHRYQTEVIPGVTSVAAASAAAGVPVVSRDERFVVIPATVSTEELRKVLAGDDAVVILKIGRNLEAVRTALQASGRDTVAVYVERASFPEQRVIPVSALNGVQAPYFSLVLVPGRRLAGEAPPHASSPATSVPGLVGATVLR